jgi:hypothetical protein
MTAACAAQACGTVEGAPGYFFKSAYEHEKQAKVSKNHGEIFWRLLVCGELLLRTRRFFKSPLLCRPIWRQALLEHDSSGRKPSARC